MIRDFKINRPYIERLRHDPRTRALFDSFISQATMLVENRHGNDMEYMGSRRAAHEIAQEAVALAMSFVLDNDSEYRMVCEERDQLMNQQLQWARLSAAPIILSTEPAKEQH